MSLLTYLELYNKSVLERRKLRRQISFANSFELDNVVKNELFSLYTMNWDEFMFLLTSPIDSFDNTIEKKKNAWNRLSILKNMVETSTKHFVTVDGRTWASV